MPRFFLEELDESDVCITGPDARHIGLSLRMRVGEMLTVCAYGRDYQCRIRSITPEEVHLDVVSSELCAAEPTVALTLYQAVPKADKLEQIIQKSVELGVTRIVPVLTRRCISRPKPAEFQKKLPRLQKIAASAAKQAGRGIIPEVAPMLTFAQACAEMQQADRAILLYEGGGVRFDEFFALDDVSFDIMPGDFYGLIGLNGSGKSTLLKVISGVYKPSAGKVTVNGTIAPLIELGAGFDMDLTARENIYLNGTVLGYTPKYIDSKFDDIVEFSELQDFLDVPLKNYSSGMVARLAFAVATITKPDILIADEILSVGDFLFQEKCEKRMAELLSGGTTVILVSHSIDQIERMCNKVAWLDHGHLRRIGATKEITAEYRRFEKKDAMPAKVTEE